MGKISDKIQKGRYSLKVQQALKTLSNLSSELTNEEARELVDHASTLVVDAVTMEGREW